MAPRQRFEARHSAPFYAVMAFAGLVAVGLALYAGLTVPRVDMQGREISGGTLWAMIGVAIVAMSFYIRRGIVRLRDRRPVVTIDHRGVTLRINKIWVLSWEQISHAELRGLTFRSRLDLQIDPEIHAAMRLPTFLFDDNFVSVKQKPFTVGVWGQGLDRQMRQALDAVRAFQPNIVKR